MTSARAELSTALARALTGDFTSLEAGAWPVRDVLAAAEDHGIGPLLWEMAVARAAEDFAGLFEPAVQTAATRDLFVQRDLRRVFDALAEAAVSALVIKGSALAYTVYRQPWLRPRTDIDLLVAQESVSVAIRALQACGYTQSAAISTGDFVSHQVAFDRTDSHGVYHVVDLHWKIANPQVVADSLPFNVLWHDAQPAPALGPNARVPCPVGSIAVACIHRLAHHQGHDRLIWLYDLKLLTRPLRADEWMALRSLACSRGVAGLCLDGLQQARARIGGHLPVEVEEALAAAAQAEPSRAYLEGPVHKRDVLASDLRLLGTWRERVRLLREHAFPPPAFIRQRYGTTSRWPLPALYLHRLVTGAFRWVRS